MEIHILELRKELKGDDVVDDWIRLFTAMGEEDLKMIKTKSPGMKEAMGAVRQMSLRRELKWLFEQREKARRDRHGEDEYVRDEGRAEGRADVIRAALAAGSSPEEICRVMKIDLEEIQDVRGSFK